MAQQEEKPQKTMTGKRPPPLPRGAMFWWLMSLTVLIWYIAGLWPRSQPKAPIPYSLFVAQVRENNVSRIHIAADVIEGKFVKQLVWPQAESPMEQSSKPTQPPSVSPKNLACGTAPDCIQRIHYDVSRDCRRPRFDASAHSTPCRRRRVFVFNSMVHRAAVYVGAAGTSVWVLLVDEQPSRT